MLQRGVVSGGISLRLRTMLGDIVRVEKRIGLYSLSFARASSIVFHASAASLSPFAWARSYQSLAASGGGMLINVLVALLSSSCFRASEKAVMFTLSGFLFGDIAKGAPPWP